MSRSFPQLLRAVGAGILLVLAGACSHESQSGNAGPDGGPTRPNIVLILLDDAHYSDFGSFYSGAYIDTPRIDRLASEGMRFTRHYVSAPLCSPTRASILSGNSPAKYGISRALSWTTRRGLPGRVVTLAEFLRSHGYATAHIGKWHLGHNKPEYHPLSQGFDQSLVGPQGMLDDYFDVTLQRDGKSNLPPDERHLTEALTESAIDFLQSAERPFFLNLWYYAPHIPVVAPSDWVDAYPADTPHRDYAALVSFADHQIGRLLDALDAAGLRDDTLVILASDNGGLRPLHLEASTPFRGWKHDLFEGGLRTPLVMRYPRLLTPGTKSDSAVSSMDLFPTLVELLGDDPDRLDFEGESFLPLLEGRPFTRTGALHWQFKPSNQEVVETPPGPFEGLLNDIAVRKGPHKLVVVDAIPQLFDLDADPGETLDLLEAEPLLAAQLLASYDGWRHRVGRIPFEVDQVSGHAVVEGGRFVLTGPARIELGNDTLFDFHDGDFSCRLSLTLGEAGRAQQVIGREESWRLSVSRGGALQLGVVSAGGSSSELTGGTVLQVGKSYDIAVSFYGFRQGNTLLRVYLDGALEIDARPRPDVAYNDRSLVVSTEAEEWLQGTVENVELYTIALTPRDLSWN